MDKQTFKKGMGAILATFPEKRIDCEVCYIFLQDLTNEEFLNAIFKIITTQKEIYSSTNIIALIREKAKEKNYLTAGEAWGIVKKEISKVGCWGKPNFEDPIIKKTVEIIGWRTLCMTERPSAERAQFMKIYDSLISREKNNIVIKKLKKIGENKK